jgi:hypothetical protein
MPLIVKLKPAVREKLERLLSQGVPLRTAGMSMGLRPRVVEGWNAEGMSLEKTPDRPKRPKDPVIGDFHGTAQEWYEHQCECFKLAQAVVKNEGLLVGKLMQNLWAISEVDPATARFLFKQYTHTHGLTEPTQAQTVVNVQADEKDAVQIYVPDNGRGPKT